MCGAAARACGAMASSSFASLPPCGGDKRNRRHTVVVPSCLVFLWTAVSVFWRRCFFPVWLNDACTATKGGKAPARRARHWGLLRILVSCCLGTIITSATEKATLAGPQLLFVASSEPDWPTPALNVNLLDPDLVKEGAPASVSDTLKYKARVEDPLVPTGAGGPIRDSPNGRVNLFPPLGGVGLADRPIVNDPLFFPDQQQAGEKKPSVETRASSEESLGKGPRHKVYPPLQLHIVEGDEGAGEPQSHLDDEPKPWEMQEKEPQEKNDLATESKEGRRSFPSDAPAVEGGHVPPEDGRLSKGDKESNSEDDTDTSEAAADEEEEDDNADESARLGDNGLDAEFPVAASVSAETPDNDEQSLRTWRNFVRPTGESEASRPLTSAGQILTNENVTSSISRLLHTEITEEVHAKNLPASKQDMAVVSADAARSEMGGQSTEKPKTLFEAREKTEDSSAGDRIKQKDTALVKEAKDTGGSSAGREVVKETPADSTRGAVAEDTTSVDTQSRSHQQRSEASPQGSGDATGEEALSEAVVAQDEEVIAESSPNMIVNKKNDNAVASSALDTAARKHNIATPHLPAADTARKAAAIAKAGAAAETPAIASAANGKPVTPVKNGSSADPAGVGGEHTINPSNSSVKSPTADFAAGSKGLVVTPTSHFEAAGPPVATDDAASAGVVFLSSSSLKVQAAESGIVDDSADDSIKETQATIAADIGSQRDLDAVLNEGITFMSENFVGTAAGTPSFKIPSFAKTVDSGALLSHHPVATRPHTLLGAPSGASVAALKLLPGQLHPVGPLDAGSPFIGAAAAVPPPVGETAASRAATLSAAQARVADSLFSSVGPSPSSNSSARVAANLLSGAAAKSRCEAEGRCEETCQEMGGSERLRALFEAMSEPTGKIRVSDVSRNNLVTAGAAAAAAPKVEERTVEAQNIEAAEDSLIRGPSDPASSYKEWDEIENHLPHLHITSQQDAAAPAAAEEKSTAQQHSVPTEGAPPQDVLKSPRTKTFFGAEVLKVEDVATSARDTEKEQSTEKNTYEAYDHESPNKEIPAGRAPVTVSEEKDRLLSAEEKQTGGSDGAADAQKNTEAKTRSSSGSSSWPKPPRQQRQEAVISRPDGEAATTPQSDTAPPEAAHHPAVAAGKVYKQPTEAADKPVNDKSNYGRPPGLGRPQHPQQQPLRFITVQGRPAQPNASEESKHRTPSSVQQKHQEDVSRQDHDQLPDSFSSRQQPPMEPWDALTEIPEESQKQRQQPTSESRRVSPQAYADLQQGVASQGLKEEEEARTNIASQLAGSTQGELGLDGLPSHEKDPFVSEDSSSELQQSQQRQSQKLEEEDDKHQQQQQQYTDMPHADSDDQSEMPFTRRFGGELVTDTVDIPSSRKFEATPLWREIERRADAYDRSRGVPVPRTSQAASQCMTGDDRKCLEAVLQRHCDSWCTAEALKKWDGKPPVWMSLHMMPVPGYWSCVREGMILLYEKHRPAVEQMVLQGVRMLTQLRIQVEEKAQHAANVGGGLSKQFQQQHPDLWLAAAWMLSVLLLCRILTGRFFFVLQLLRAATECVFGCRRHARGFSGDAQRSVDCAALAIAQAVLADKQIKWLLTQTKKTSFLCEKIKGKLEDRTLQPLSPVAAAVASATGAASSMAPAGTGEHAGGGIRAAAATPLFGISETRRDAEICAHATATQHHQLQMMMQLLQQMIHEQQQTTRALNGLQQRVDSLSVRQDIYEAKVQEAAAGYSAVFETNSLQQIDSNFAVLRLTMQVLQKLDRELTPEMTKPLETTFLAHMDAANEAIAAIKARQLRALFGGAPSGAHVGEKTHAEAPSVVASITAGSGLPTATTSTAAKIALMRGPGSSASITEGGGRSLISPAGPPSAAVHLTASASLSITSGLSAPLVASGGVPPPPVTAGAAVATASTTAEVSDGVTLGRASSDIVGVHQHHSPHQELLTPSTEGEVSSIFAGSRTKLPWLLRQLWHIQRSLPELLMQPSDFNAQLVVTRKVGETEQQVVLVPKESTFNCSSSILPRALGSISAAVSQLLSGNGCTREALPTATDRFALRYMPPPLGGSAALSAPVTLTPLKVQQEQRHPMTGEASLGPLNMSRTDGAAPLEHDYMLCSGEGMPSNVSSGHQPLPPPSATTAAAAAKDAGEGVIPCLSVSMASPRKTHDKEEKIRDGLKDVAAEEGAAVSVHDVAATSTTPLPRKAPEAAGTPFSGHPGDTVKAPYSPMKQQTARRSVAALFGETAGVSTRPETSPRHRRSPLAKCFPPDTNVDEGPQENAAVNAVNTSGDFIKTPVDPAVGGASCFAEGLPLGKSAVPSVAPAIFSAGHDDTDGVNPAISRPLMVTPHFPPAPDPSSIDAESSAADSSLLLPAMVPHSGLQSPCGVIPADHSSLVASPPGGPIPLATGTSPVSTGLPPSLSDGSVGTAPSGTLPLHPPSTTANFVGTTSPFPPSLTSKIPEGLQDAGSSSPVSISLTATGEVPLVPMTAENENGSKPIPHLMTDHIGMTAGSGAPLPPASSLLPSSSHAFGTAAVTGAGTSPSSVFQYASEDATAAGPLLAVGQPSAPTSSIYDSFSAATVDKGMNRQLHEEEQLLLNKGTERSAVVGSSSSSLSAPRADAFFVQQQPPAAEEEGGGAGIISSPSPPPATTNEGDFTGASVRSPPVHAGQGKGGGGVTTAMSSLLPTPVQTSATPMPPQHAPPPSSEGIQTPPPLPLSGPHHSPISSVPPTALQIPNGIDGDKADGEAPRNAATSEAPTDRLNAEGGPAPLPPSSMLPGGVCAPPVAFRGNAFPHPPPSSAGTSMPPAGRPSAYQRPTTSRFARERRREMPKVQAATNPFGFAAPPASVAAAAGLQQRGGGGVDGGAAA